MQHEVPRLTLKQCRRERLSLTQEEFAEQLGVDKATVSSWERPLHPKTPRLRTRRKIAELCGLTVSQIVWPGEDASQGKTEPAKAA